VTGLGYDDRYFQTSAFEIRCPNCRGDGEGPYEPGDTGICPQCKGKGTVPTTLGEELHNFLRRHPLKEG
jgi:DnaJ-class molecular chaperone